jgi:hypothetical protein
MRHRLPLSLGNMRTSQNCASPIEFLRPLGARGGLPEKAAANIAQFRSVEPELIEKESDFSRTAARKQTLRD